MYICDFSRSVGAGSATTRNTRGLTRSVIRLIVPPLPAVSRPSNTMQIFAPVAFTHSCSATSSPWRGRSSCSYSFRFIRGFGVPIGGTLIDESGAASSGACDVAAFPWSLCFAIVVPPSLAPVRPPAVTDLLAQPDHRVEHGEQHQEHGGAPFLDEQRHERCGNQDDL